MGRANAMTTVGVAAAALRKMQCVGALDWACVRAGLAHHILCMSAHTWLIMLLQDKYPVPTWPFASQYALD